MQVFIVMLFMVISIEPHSIDNTRIQNTTSDSKDIKYLILANPGSKKIDYEVTKQQSANIHHIIATEQKNLENQRKQEKSLEIDSKRFPSLDELRFKCQNFARLFGLNKQSMTSQQLDNTEMSSSNANPITNDSQSKINVTRRPVFIRNKPTFIQETNEDHRGSFLTEDQLSNVKPFHTSYQKSSNTQPNTRTRMVTTTISTIKKSMTLDKNHSVEPNIQIKYTKFEPIILQKTILTDGRVMYHWHRSLPTSALELQAPVPVATSIARSQALKFPTHPMNSPVSDSSTETPFVTESTSTTEKSSWLFVPFGSLFGGNQEQESTTVETDNISHPSTINPITIKSRVKERVSSTEDDISTKLKLVVPIHYDDTDAGLSSQTNRYYNKNEDINSVTTVIGMKTLDRPQQIDNNNYRLGYNRGQTYGFVPWNQLLTPS